MCIYTYRISFPGRLLSYTQTQTQTQTHTHTHTHTHTGIPAPGEEGLYLVVSVHIQTNKQTRKQTHTSDLGSPRALLQLDKRSRDAHRTSPWPRARAPPRGVASGFRVEVETSSKEAFSACAGLATPATTSTTAHTPRNDPHSHSRSMRMYTCTT